MGLPAMDITGGAGGSAGPSTSGGGRFDSRGITGEGQSGSRGFVNNFAATGASLKTDAGINSPAGGGFPWSWAALVGVAFAVWYVMRKG